jgi:FMN-dependent NADH-azoreductase
VITTRGGSYSAGSLDFQEPYLRAVFELIGITDMTFIHAENLSEGAEVRQQSLATTRAAIQQVIASWRTSQNLLGKIDIRPA